MTPARGGREPSGRWSYGAWRDGPDPLAPPFDIRRLVDELGERVLAGESLREVLADLREHGSRDRPGLDALRRQLSRRRRQLRRRGNLGGVLDEVRAELDQALAAERDALAGQDSEAARFAELELATLPDATAAAVRALADYSWQSEEARQRYQQITQRLTEQVLEQQFAGLKQALSGNDPQASEAVRQMLADLNDLLDDHARGLDTSDKFAAFMAAHGQFFDPPPADVDELVEQLARRQADAQRLMASLSREQRAELGELMQQAMTDAGLAEQLGRLQDNLTALRPGMADPRGMMVDGERGLGYGEATQVVGDLADVEALEAQLGQGYAGAGLDDVDAEAIERQLGAEAVADLRSLQQLERELERQGWLSGTPEQLALSPKALRRLGQTALGRVFADLTANRRGDHDDRRTGAADERTGAYLAWELGGEQPVDAVRTLLNSLTRRAGEDHTGPGGPTLVAEDFVVAETERRTTAAVALCVDLSYSMVQAERWGPMKQTALALSHLVSTRFRTDALEVIGFDRTARRLTPLELAAVEPSWQQGTNLAHALSLAARHLHRHPEAEPVVLVVTDGEPTAHLLPDGTPYFAWPPETETLRATLAQVDRLTRARASLNFFRLGDDPGLARFLDAVARRAGGRVLAPSTERLGEYVVADYLRARRGGRGAAPRASSGPGSPERGAGPGTRR